MYENKIVKVTEPDDPRRCQAVAGNRQCPNQAMEGVTYCQLHGGPPALLKIEKQDGHLYRLAKYQERVLDLAQHPEAKTIRNEIGILRMVLEEIINKCSTPNDLFLYSAKINDTVTRIEKCVIACNRLETANKVLLDKQAAMQLASQIIGVIGNNITDADLLSRIGDQILELLKDERS